MSSSWTLREQIAQLIVVRTTGRFFDGQIRYPQWEATSAQLQQWLGELNIGGVIVLGGSAAEVSLRTAQLQAWAQTPLLISADIEEGVGHRFEGATWFPPPMALAAIADPDQASHLARQMGRVTAQEAIAMGINWLLAPVVDVNNNPQNPVINVRAFGDTPEQVSRLATAFIEGAQDFPVLTTAKHFPGHGNTATDSHLSLPTIPHSIERLAQIELPPFQAAIAAGVDTVMSAHILFPAWDKTAPATLSHRALTQFLRQELGFTGLVVTDALVMAGITQWGSPEEVCVQAIAAGADILLMPPDPVAAIDAVEQAVHQGQLSAERIAESVQRVHQAKQKVKKLHDESPLVNLAQVNTPESKASVLELLTASQSCSQGNAPRYPSPESAAWNIVVVPDLLNCDYLGNHTPAIARPRSAGYTETHLVNYDQFAQLTPPAGAHLLQLFVRGNPFRGQAGLSIVLQQQLKSLLKQDCLGAIVLYGSPYVRDWLIGNCPQHLFWFFSYGQMPDAQKLAMDAVLESTEPQSSRIQGFI